MFGSVRESSEFPVPNIGSVRSSGLYMSGVQVCTCDDVVCV